MVKYIELNGKFRLSYKLKTSSEIHEKLKTLKNFFM